MAVGDFDNDGYANEIAVTETDTAAIHVHVLRITHTGSNSTDPQFSITPYYEAEVDRYVYGGYDNYRRKGVSMDGLTCNYTQCVVAGDFDGDGQTEFAVVYRDISPQDTIFTKHHNDVNSAYDFTTFRGYTGHIHVKIYKWDGSGFQTEEDSRAFDQHKFALDKDRGMLWHDIDVPLGLKAAVGDFDGDGRDDIAVLRVMLQYTEQMRYYTIKTSFSFSNFVFGAFVDWYTFDYGSIKPKYNAHSKGSHPWNYGDNANGWVGIRAENIWLTDNLFDKKYNDLDNLLKDFYLKPLTGEETPYPIIDREFDIIAGKFSGRVGTITTCDDLVIKYPQWASGVSGNKLRSHVALMTNIPGVTNWGTQVHEITSLPDRDHLLAFTKADYLNESITLEDPVKLSNTKDFDYSAILQMFPYHVDNLTEDGTALTKAPRSFTLRLKTAVTYNNTSSSSETKNLTSKMTAIAETIFAFDNPALRFASKTFQGIRGITSAVLGSNDTAKKIEGAGAIWDKLKDTIETTTTESNENAISYVMSTTTIANRQDTLLMNQSTHYLWRYPIKQVPAPAWLLGKTKDNIGSFDKSQAKSQQSYITFAMSDPAKPTTSIGINDVHYQPYHEVGNLFSYPAALERTEGYEGRTSLTAGTYEGQIRWDGSEFQQKIMLSITSTDQESTKKVNRVGAITKLISVLDNIFGTNMANIPADTESTFTRSVTDGESISINIPAAFSGARFTALFETYLDIAGTMTAAFAVERFYRDDALWGDNSLYTLKPDPSFLLPEKFNISAKEDSDFDRAVFTVNANDPTAMKMRGVRYKAADYDLDSDNLLFKGIKYAISVPVYNASFKDADNLKVRLSYSKTRKYNDPKTKIDEYTFTKLPGWGNGNNRQYANFTWTPTSMDDGIYYIFAEIDPDNAIDEVHENRRNASGDIVDCGGNNMGYRVIGIASTEKLTFERDKLRDASISASDVWDEEELPYIRLSAGGLDVADYFEKYVSGQSSLVPVEFEFDYGGTSLMHDAAIMGYKLKPESKGKSLLEIEEDDVELIFLNTHLSFFPNDNEHVISFRMNPAYLEDGVGFVVLFDNDEWVSKGGGVFNRGDLPITEIIYGSAGTNPEAGISSSSGGCYSGFGLMAGLAVLGFALAVKKR